MQKALNSELMTLPGGGKFCYICDLMDWKYEVIDTCMSFN